MVQMRRRALHPTASFLSLVGVIAVIDARAIYDFPMEIRKRNYVRLSTEKCDECVTIEDFYASNPFGFVLFYERAIMGNNKYKEAIVRGWMESCKELRFSRIACGMVDMLTDKPYGERYIDTKTAPAHICTRNGEPIMAKKEQVDVLLSRPGDKEIMLGHVADLFRDDGTRGNLTLSSLTTNKESLQRLLKQHRLVIAAFAGEEQRLSDAFRAGVQEAVLVNGMAIRVSGQPSEARGGKGKGKRDDKWRVGFVAVQGKGQAAHYATPAAPATDRSIAAFLDGKLLPGALSISAEAKPGDPEVLKAVRKVTAKGLKAAEGKKATKGHASEL